MTDAITPISYAEWGQRFFALAVTEERVLAGVNTLAGQPIDVGPMGVGPGRIAKVTAQGAIGQAVSEPVAGEVVSYRVTLPVSLTFDVHLQVDTHRFRADLEVPLILTALAGAGLEIFIDVAAPLPNQVQIDLRADGLRASMLNRVVGVEGELKRFVAKYVSREVQKESIMKARTIDVARAIDGAWTSVAPQGTASREFTADLGPALEKEIEDNPGLLEDLEN